MSSPSSLTCDGFHTPGQRFIHNAMTPGRVPMFDSLKFKPTTPALIELLRLNDTDALPTGNTDVFYRALCPTDAAANVAYRENILHLAYDHPRAADFRRLFYTLASRDLLWYCNTFLYTLASKDSPDAPVRPFVTWPYQNRDILKIQAAIGVHDFNITKSRDMGATWQILVAIEHRWHFRPNQRFMLASSKEDLVEKPGDMDALFEKVDFLHKYQPCWLLPTGRDLGNADPCRTRKHLENADNGSSIEGTATVEDLGRGGRYTALMIDEYASIPFCEAIERASRSSTSTRIRNSTPKPRNAEGATFFKFFDREFRKDPSDDNPKLAVEHWTLHPLKSRGLYKLDDAGLRLDLDPNTYDWRSDFPFTKQNMPRSIWFDEQEERADSFANLMQEENLDFYGLGRRAFDANLLKRLRAKTRPPAGTYQVYLDENSQLLIIPNAEGNFRVWCPFAQNDPPVAPYIFGEDIALGTAGDFSANSAICIIDASLRQVVATYADNSIDPGRFAQLCHALGKLFHNPFHCPETNGVGVTFMAALIPLTKNIIIRGQHEENAMVRKTKRYGIHNHDRGTILMSQLQIDLMANQLSIPDENIIHEIDEYELSDKDSKIVHGGSSDPESAAHGDLAIATCCAAAGLRERPAAAPHKLHAEPPKLDDSFSRLADEDAILANCVAHREQARLNRDRFDRWEP